MEPNLASLSGLGFPHPRACNQSPKFCGCCCGKGSPRNADIPGEIQHGVGRRAAYSLKQAMAPILGPQSWEDTVCWLCGQWTWLIPQAKLLDWRLPATTPVSYPYTEPLRLSSTVAHPQTPNSR